MHFLVPLAAAVFQAGSLALDKTVLSLERVSYKTYAGLGLPLYFLVVMGYFILFDPPFTASLFHGRLLWMMIGLVAVTVASNLLYYRALDGDRLTEMEMLTLLQSVPVVLATSLVFASERQPELIGLALVVLGAVLWSHWERRHFRMHRRTLQYVLASLLLAPASAITIKTLLAVWHPITLELVRSGGLALAMSLGFLTSGMARRIAPGAFWLLVLTNVLSATGWILFYTSVARFGLIYSILLFSIHPLLVYAASLLLLNERPEWKKNVAFVIVLAAVTTAQMIP